MSKKSKIIKGALDAQGKGYAVDEQALNALLQDPKAVRSAYSNFANAGGGDYSDFIGSLTVPQQASAPPVYSEGVQSFIDQMMSYETAKSGEGYLLSLKDPAIKANMAEGDWQKLIDSQSKIEDLYMLGREFHTNSGKSAGSVFADPNAQYRLRNERGKDMIVSEGGGLMGLDEIYRQATELSTTQKKKANWDVEMMNPETGRWELVAHDDPKKLGKTLLKVAAIAAPIAGAIFLPMLAPALAGALGGGLLGGAAVAGIGAAGGSALVGTLQGKSLGKIAKGALISGASGFAGGMLAGAAGLGGAAAATGGGGSVSGITGGPWSGFGSGFAGGAGGLAGTSAGSVIGGLGGAFTITAPKVAGSVLPGLIAGGVGAGAGAAAAGGLGGTLGGQGGPLEPVEPDYTHYEGGEPGIDIVGNPLPPSTLPSDFWQQIAAGLPAAGAGALDTVTPTTPEEEIVIEGDKTNLDQTTPHEGVPGLPTDLLPDNFWDKPVDAEGKPLDTVEKILNYFKAGMTGFGILGNLFGGLGGGGSTQGKIPAGFFGGTDDRFKPGGVMGSTLPGANLPNVGMPGGPRTMPQQDWHKYGTRPEQSFWNDIPQGYLPPLPTGEDIWSKQARGYARGGEVVPQQGALSVVGPGTGTSDDIPAMLSDGEYVFDAATVAAIGNGSTEKGFEKLDRMRRQVKRNKRPKRAKRAPRSLGVMYAAQ